MNVKPASINVAKATAGLLARSGPEWAMAGRLGTAIMFAEHARRTWLQESKHAEAVYVGGAGDSGVGRDRAWYNGRGAATVTRLVVDLLPEWTRRSLWHALSERYGTVTLDDSQWATYDGTNDVPYAPI